MSKDFFVDVFATKVGNSFWAPIVGPKNDVVKNFVFAINTEGTQLFVDFKHADLFLIGRYDCSKGVMKSCKHILVKSGVTAKLPSSFVEEEDGQLSIKVGE